LQVIVYPEGTDSSSDDDDDEGVTYTFSGSGLESIRKAREAHEVNVKCV